MKLSDFKLNNWVYFWWFSNLYDFFTTFLFLNYKTGTEGNPIVLLFGWPIAILVKILGIILISFWLSHKNTKIFTKICQCVIPFSVVFVANTGGAIDALKILISNYK